MSESEHSEWSDVEQRVRLPKQRRLSSLSCVEVESVTSAGTVESRPPLTDLRQHSSVRRKGMRTPQEAARMDAGEDLPMASPERAGDPRAIPVTPYTAVSGVSEQVCLHSLTLSPPFTHSLTHYSRHSTSHSLTPSSSHSLTRPLIHSPTLSPSRPLTLSLTHPPSLPPRVSSSHSLILSASLTHSLHSRSAHATPG